MRRQTYSPELNRDIYTSNAPKDDSILQTTNMVYDKIKSNQGLRPHHKGKLVTNSVIVSTERETPKISGNQNELSDALLARRILQQSVPTAQEELIAQLPLNHHQILELHQLKYNDDKRKKVTSFDGGQMNKKIEHFAITVSKTNVMTPTKERNCLNGTPPPNHTKYIAEQFQSENVTVKGVSVTVKLPNQTNGPIRIDKKTETSNVDSQHRLGSSQESSFKAITDGPNSEYAASNSQINPVNFATTPSVLLKITKNRKGDTWIKSEQSKRTWQVETEGSLLQSTLNSHRNVMMDAQSQNNSERVQQTMHLKMCLKKFTSLKDPVSTIKKITDGTFDGEELGIPASRQSLRRNPLISSISRRPTTQGNAGTIKTIQIIDDQLETSKIASGQEHAFQQSKQLGEFLNPQQYNGANCERFLYPTQDNLKGLKKIFKNNKFLQAMTMQSSRDRSIKIDQLTYHDQKEFFRLDKAYEKTFVQKHEQKVKKSSDQLSVALMANLKRERINIFKQFLNEDESRKIDYNKTQFNSKVPFLRTPHLRVLMQGDEEQGDQGFLAQQRDEILKTNQPFRQRQIRQV